MAATALGKVVDPISVEVELSRFQKLFERLFLFDRYAEALAEAQKIEHFVASNFGDRNWRVASALIMQARVYAKLQRNVEAEQSYLRAITITENSQGSD